MVSGGQSLSWQLRAQGGHPPWTGYTSIAGPLIPTHTHSDWDRQVSSPHVHNIGIWEETGVLGQNPHRHGENMQTPHIQWPSQVSISFLITYNEMTLNETMLFEDLLYIAHAQQIYVKKNRRR